MLQRRRPSSFAVTLHSLSQRIHSASLTTVSLEITRNSPLLARGPALTTLHCNTVMLCIVEVDLKLKPTAGLESSALAPQIGYYGNQDGADS